MKKYRIEMRLKHKPEGVTIKFSHFIDWTLRWNKYEKKRDRDKAVASLNKKGGIFEYRAKDLDDGSDYETEIPW